MTITVKAQVVSVANKQIAVIPDHEEYSDKLYGFPPREGVERGQFVDIEIHDDGRSASWPE